MTICVKEMKQDLATIEKEQVKLNVLGEIAKMAWRNLPNHYPHVNLGELVIMSNHVHGILWITKSAIVGEGFKPSPTQHGLSEIIRGYKTYSARKVNELLGSKGRPFWQRGFYDHVIRDENDLHQHREYIQNNPLKWELDKYYL